MKIKTRRFVNPRFGVLDVAGEVLKLEASEADGGKKISTFLMASPDIRLKVREDVIRLSLSPDLQTIDELSVAIGDYEYCAAGLEGISDLLSVIKALDIRDYWTKPDLNFLLYTFIKFSVCILTAEKTREYCNTHEEATGETCKYFDKQRQLAMLLNHMLESCHIQYSNYVHTQRAQYLLLLGLNPKETYTTEQIKTVGKKWMKLIHPDAELGNDELFKNINQAVTNLK